MRKLFLAALLTVTVAASAFAKDVNSKNVRAVNRFNSEFGDAENVSWTMKSNFAKATFYLNGEKREAFYDLNGEMIGTSRNIALDKLPAGAKKLFAKKYDGYTVKEAIRFEGIEESAYYISAENDKVSVILKFTESNAMSVFKKEAKN
jgi:hypothetical protein